MQTPIVENLIIYRWALPIGAVVAVVAVLSVVLLAAVVVLLLY